MVDGVVEGYQGKYEILKGYSMVGTIKDLESDDDIDTLIRSTLYKVKALG